MEPSENKHWFVGTSGEIHCRGEFAFENTAGDFFRSALTSGLTNFLNSQLTQHTISRLVMRGIQPYLEIKTQNHRSQSKFGGFPSGHK